MQSATERRTTIGPAPPAQPRPLIQSDLPAGRSIVRLRDDLDIAGAPALRERLIGVLRPRTRLVVLDLSRVRSCDPVGLAVLVGLQRRARLRGIVVRLAAPSLPVSDVLRSTGLERCFTVCPDLPSALGREGAIPQALAS